MSICAILAAVTEWQKIESAANSELPRLTGLVGRALGLPGLGSERAPEPIDWDSLIALAERHRVLPLLHSGLKASPEIVIPEGVSSRFALRVRDVWRRSLILSQELVRISRLLSSRQILMAALKGPGLSAQAYGTGTARAMRDLDILIRPSDFRQAQTVLESAGFVCEESFCRLAPPLADLYLRRATHITFQHAVLGYLLEVHLRSMQVPVLLPLATETLLAEACPVALGGGEVPVLAFRHHFLYTAAHGAKHGWWRLLWLADFAAFQRHFSEDVFSSLKMEDEFGLGTVLEAARNLSRHCFGGPLCEPNGKAVRSAQSMHALVAYGQRCLVRGGPSITYTEKWDELFQLLRLRPEAAYRREVAKLYWDLTVADLETLTQLSSCSPMNRLSPTLLANLAPALRPVLWASRRMRPR